MENQLFNDWLHLMADPNNALKHPVGTSIWLDGIEEVKALTASTFFKPIESLTKSEARSLNILAAARENSLPQGNFWVSGHSCLIQNSLYYQAINNKEAFGKTEYLFVEDDLGEFCPWRGVSVLGNKFYSDLDGQIRIPYYTFNHENTHLLFKNIYSNIDIENEEMCALIILVEWFCISMDLILAYDLIRNQQLYALAELYRVPAKKSENNVFQRYCRNFESVDYFANKFRSVFIDKEENEDVYELISSETLEKHRNFAREEVLTGSRQIPSAMVSEDARILLSKLRTLSLSELVYDFTGVRYV